jgi:aspartyl-tRNA(Asn)/glutamyl-tRNA(Gln) amidotransferase subunit B
MKTGRALPCGMREVAAAQLKVGLEIHVELSTRSKMFSRAPNPAHVRVEASGPNTLIDPVVLALPGSLPVMNVAAVEMAMMVGLALGCRVATFTKWDRKAYFYPDLPKAYQISQYDLPLCLDGSVEMPPCDAGGNPIAGGAARRVGIIRAHLEEDAGKLLHEAPGGRAIDFSIVDLNRAGTPLLEIVTAPDFTAADDVVAFARMLRDTCRFLGVTEGVMEKGHIRFEPNINMVLTLDDGDTAVTPISEVKNLNSFKALGAAIEHEAREQPRRWRTDGRVHGPGQKRTMGWDDARGVTIVRREKEDAHDYRYFPDPDLPPVVVDTAWRDRVAARIPELPHARRARYATEFALGTREAAALTEDRGVCLFFEACVEEMKALGITHARSGRLAANLILQNATKRANERGAAVDALGITPSQLARLAKLREDGRVGPNAVDELLGLCVDGPASDVEELARSRGLLTVRDDATLGRWCREAVEAHPQAAADVRAGKMQAIGRLVGEVMKRSGGQADASAARERLLAVLRGS